MHDRLLNDHDKMRRLAMAMRDVFNGPAPSDMRPLAQMRWSMASRVMSHLAFEDRAFYSKIESHPDVAKRLLAERFRSELVETFTAYSDHCKSWTPRRIRCDWDVYRKAALDFIAWLLDRVDREEAELYPLIVTGAVDSTTRNLIPVSWTGEAFTIKEKMGV